MPDTLAEELLLLAYDLRGKCRIGSVELDCGVGGALLSDLRLAGRVTLDGDALAVVTPEPVGDPILDGLLAEIDTAPRRRSPREWITRMRATDHQERLLTRMARRGRVAADRHRTLGVFAENRHPVRDIVGLWEAQQRVVGAATLGTPADARTLALGALVAAAGLSKAVFATSGNWRALRARMLSMTGDDWIAAAVRQALAAERGNVPV